MSAPRFYVQPNGCGGWETIDRRTGRTVTHSAFREFCDKAVARLCGWTDWTVDEARTFYGVGR